uniref:Uncharacterized protein n=1 Tax=Arundo donax TaxID=35708 RepID=A0A0A9DZX3_ARUDO
MIRCSLSLSPLLPSPLRPPSRISSHAVGFCKIELF